MRILLVEDEVAMIAIIAKMLNFEGIDTIIAHDGLQAKEVLEHFESKINAIFCDIMMPGMDGYEFLEYVKQTEKFADIPFIFASAHVSPDDEAKGISMGAKAFLKKPIDISTLLSAINQYAKD